jgi:hypothetical protein
MIKGGVPYNIFEVEQSERKYIQEENNFNNHDEIRPPPVVHLVM